MGFCLFNSVVVGAQHALQQPNINRVAILDFDVHHCNGTVDLCLPNPDILVCSTFQHPWYPGRYVDVDADHIKNSPLAAGSGSEAFRRAVETDWLPALDQHKPDIILISAGFDAHEQDPLGGLLLQNEDYYWVTKTILDAANTHCGGRVVSALEGGYDLNALADSTEAHLSALLSA